MGDSISLTIRASQIKQGIKQEDPEQIIAKTKAILAEDDSL